MNARKIIIRSFLVMIGLVALSKTSSTLALLFSSNALASVLAHARVPLATSNTGVNEDQAG